MYHLNIPSPIQIANLICGNFLTNCKRSKILQQDSSSKLASKNSSNPFFKNSTGCYSPLKKPVQISTLCYTSFSETYPLYLSELLTVYYPSRQLRSISDMKTFCIPLTKQKRLENELFFHRPKTVELIAT